MNGSGSGIRQHVEVPVVEEQLVITKRQIEAGTVAIHIEPKVEERIVDVPLAEETIEVQRVPVNRFVDGPVPVRTEGDVTIVPVFEEVIVMEKRLMLKEEIHLVRRRVQTHERRSYFVRTEEVHILQSDPPLREKSPEGTGIAKSPESRANRES